MRRLAFYLFVGVASLTAGLARGEGRAGTVQFSDGQAVAGRLSLSPGKDLRVFTAATAVSVSLAEVKEMRFKIEKEEMRQGFYFPNAGQATQAKTGDVYPVRYLSVEITLAGGGKVTGHLMTTALYAESDQGTQKIVLMAKMTGADGQKLADLKYPTVIRFDDAGAAGALSEIDLTQAGFTPLHAPVIFARPDLALLPASQIGATPVWTMPMNDPGRVWFAVEASDGIHVAWPDAGTADGALVTTVNAALREMHDFFDTRSLLGCVDDGDDVYSLVMLTRTGPTDSFSAGTIPWSLVALRWKYDPEQKQVTLLNRTNLAWGRTKNSPAPVVYKQPELLRDIGKAGP